jgi:hypothetical protein
MNSCRSFLLLLFAGQATAFTTDRFPASKKTICGPLSSQLCDDLVNDATNRRQFVSRAFFALLSPALLTSGASPAAADVSDGNALPQGAAQFGRIIRAKSDLVVRTVVHNGVFHSWSSPFLYCPAHQIFPPSTWLIKLQTTLYYT